MAENGASEILAPLIPFSGPSRSNLITALRSCIVACIANACFGYHIGILNGPLESIVGQLGYSGSSMAEGVTISIFLVGCCLGSPLGGFFSDKFGRKRNFQLDSIPLALGAVLCATAYTLIPFLIGRFLIGVGVGAAAGFAPMYISEISPKEYRGKMGCLCQIFTCLGLILGLFVGIPAEHNQSWWRVLFWIGAGIPLIMAAGMEFSAESPLWLSNVGRKEEAKANFVALLGESEASKAISSLEEAQNIRDKSREKEIASWGELVAEKNVRVTAVSVVLFVLQQLSGINGVLFFSSSTFSQVGVSNPMLASAAVGVANLLGSLLVVALMERTGRRELLMHSYAGMTLFLAVLVASLAIPLPAGLSQLCSVMATLGYVFMFALGAGPVTAVIIPEMATTALRAKVVAASFFANWVFNFSVGLLFLDFVGRFGAGAVYSMFAAVSLFSVFFVKHCVVETRGQALQEVTPL